MATIDRLNLTCRRRGTQTVITATGALTRATVMQLRSTLLAALHRGGSGLILDLRGVSRVDEFGLDALGRTAARARLAGGQLHLVAPAPAVAARLRSSGLAWQLALHPNLATALAAAGVHGNGNGPDGQDRPGEVVPIADRVEQQQPAVPAADGALDGDDAGEEFTAPACATEAGDADLLEQRRLVPVDDDRRDAE